MKKNRVNVEKISAYGAIGCKYLVQADQIVVIGGREVRGPFKAIVHLHWEAKHPEQVLRKGQVEFLAPGYDQEGQEGSWVSRRAQDWARRQEWPAYEAGKELPAKLHCYGAWSPVEAGILQPGEVALPLFRMSGTEWLIVKGEVKGINA